MTKQTRKESIRKKRQSWQAIIAAWQQSGMSRAGYCCSRDLKIKSFSYCTDNTTKKWRALQDSNLRPTDSKSVALSS